MFYFVAGSFALGVALRTLVTVSVPTMAWVLLLGFVVAVVARKNSSTVFTRHLFTLSFCLLALTLGLLRTELNMWNYGHSLLEADVGTEVELTGVVIREPEIKERSQSLYIESGSDIVQVSTDRLSAIEYGDEVVVIGELKKPESFTTDLGRTFKYEKYLLAKGVEYQISFASVEVLSNKNANPVIYYLLQLKHHLMTGIETVLPEPQAGLGEGLLLGVKQALGSSLEDDFRTTGIVHIVVLSGYNIMLVVAFVMYILALLFTKKLRIGIGILSIVAFALIVGLSATVVRASIMASLLLVAQAYGKNYQVLRGLFFAGLVMIFINPLLLLYDIGFQLSFMATIGLILVAPWVEKFVTAVPTKVGVRDFLVATIATQIAVLPILLYNIGQVSLIAVAVNVLVLPAVPPAMLLTFIAGVIALFSGTLAVPFAFGAYLSLSYIILIAESFAQLPLASVSVPTFPAVWVIAMYIVPVVGFLWYRHYRSNLSAVSDWVIEEEADIKGAPLAEAAPDTKDTPIFFR